MPPQRPRTRKSDLTRPKPSLSERRVESLYAEWGGGLLTLDGYDECILGVVTRVDMPPIVCYDRQKVIDRLAADMPRDEAEDGFVA